MTDEELIKRLRSDHPDHLTSAAADRIEALLVGHELQEVIDKQAALLADAYGADLDWEEVLKQRADHEAVKRIEALTKERDEAMQLLKTLSNMNGDLSRDLYKTKLLLAKAVEALQWCSGSADFNEGGVAREGWLKVCAPLLKGESHD